MTLWDIRPIPRLLLPHFNQTSHYLLLLLTVLAFATKTLRAPVACYGILAHVAVDRIAKLVAQAWLAWRLPVLHSQSLALEVTWGRPVLAHLALQLVPLVWFSHPTHATPLLLVVAVALTAASVTVLLGSLVRTTHSYMVRARTICLSDTYTSSSLCDALDPL
jgi:hypothetical protein